MTSFDRDGYRIHYSRAGSGPRLVWVDPALGSRLMRPLQDVVDGLADRFEMVSYDRRGRGLNAPAGRVSSGDEVSDLRALLDHVGGADAVLGFSSGAGLVLHATPGLPVRTLVLLEPAVDPVPDRSGLRERIAEKLADGALDEAVLAFYDGTGVPDEVVGALAASEAWPDVVRAAPTLLADIDLAVVGDGTCAAVDLPVHVVLSTGSPDELTRMGEDLASRLRATVWHEPGGWHGVEADALTARLAALVAGPATPGRSTGPHDSALLD